MYAQVNKLKTFHVFLIAVIVSFLSLLAISNPGSFTVKNTSNQIVSPLLQNEKNIKGIGVVGDSLSDEYQADDSRGSYLSNDVYNWVELLAEYRGLNFGEWGDGRPEPRRTGYEFNWSKSGATARSVVETGQHTGLADQIKDGRVNYVVIYIGANDFAPYTSNGYPALYSESLNDEQIAEKINSIVVDIRTTIETLQSAGEVSILLLKIPDWGNRYSIQQNYPDESSRERVTTAIETVNEKLAELAEEKNLMIADPNDFYTNLIDDSNDNLIKIGEVELIRDTPSHNPTSEYLSDDIHFGTIMNGLFANFIISKLEQIGSEEIGKFEVNELAEIAGISSN